MNTNKEKLPKTLQTSDATKVGQYKRRTWYKRQTAGTHVGLRQTSDQYKHWTITNTGPVQMSDR